MEPYKAEKSKVAVLGSLFIGFFYFTILSLLLTCGTLLFSITHMDSDNMSTNSTVQTNYGSESYSSHLSIHADQMMQHSDSLINKLHSLPFTNNVIIIVILVTTGVYMCISILGIVGGIKLLKMSKGSRTYGFVLSAISIVLFGPIGIVVGIIGLYILLDNRTIAYFEAHRYA